MNQLFYIMSTLSLVKYVIFADVVVKKGNKSIWKNYIIEVT